MSAEGHQGGDRNLLVGLTREGISGTSSAKTTAKPLQKRTDQFDQQNTQKGQLTRSSANQCGSGRTKGQGYR